MKKLLHTKRDDKYMNLQRVVAIVETFTKQTETEAKTGLIRFVIAKTKFAFVTITFNDGRCMDFIHGTAKTIVACKS
ncbi:hypothetical protein CCR75_000880 [Bremia lactucae]|nr:hypothetical protein CCR75_000880 [Bremia lactucae]